MKKCLAILLAAAVLLVSGCGAKPQTPAATAAPTMTRTSSTELTTAPATEIPTTEAVVTEPPTTVPTTEAPTETEAPPEIDRSAEAVYQNHTELTPVNYESPSLLPISEDAGEEYLDRITFLCESPTYWMWPFGLLNGGTETKQIWTGPEGTMTLKYLRGYKMLDPFDNVERTIAETAALHHPDILVIALGLNGLSAMTETQFKTEYCHLIDEIREASPDTQIILQSLYPLLPTFKHWGEFTNALLSEANAWILEIAEDYGLPYLDTFSALLAEDGNAHPEWMMNDGLHPNKEGLQQILLYIRTHAWKDE